MDSLQNTCTRKVMYGFPYLCAVLCCKNKFCSAGTGHLDLRILIHVTIGMTGQCNRFLPVSDAGFYSLYYNGSPENRSVQCRTDRTVGTLPHLL